MKPETSKPGPVEAAVYRVWATDSTMRLPGFSRQVEEIYIPSERIAFNFTGYDVRIVVSKDVDPSRYDNAEKICEIKVYPGLLNLLRAYLDAEEKVTTQAKDLLVGVEAGIDPDRLASESDSS